MQLLRDNWPKILSESRLVADGMNMSPELKEDRRKRAPREKIEEDVISPEDKFKRDVFLPILDTTIAQLNQRFKGLVDISNIFSPLLNFDSLSKEEIHEKSMVLAQKYPNVLTSALGEEIVHLKTVFKSTFKECSDSKLISIKLLNSIYELHLEGVFPEVCIGLRIFFSLPVTVAEGERSFSKLSLIKNYLRSTMLEDRLNGLAILSIEHELAKKINFDDVIRDFANIKVRRLV